MKCSFGSFGLCRNELLMVLCRRYLGPFVAQAHEGCRKKNSSPWIIWLWQISTALNDMGPFTQSLDISLPFR